MLRHIRTTSRHYTWRSSHCPDRCACGAFWTRSPTSSEIPGNPLTHTPPLPPPPLCHSPRPCRPPTENRNPTAVRFVRPIRFGFRFGSITVYVHFPIRSKSRFGLKSDLGQFLKGRGRKYAEHAKQGKEGEEGKRRGREGDGGGGARDGEAGPEA